MKVFTKQTVHEFFHVLAIIFPLTLVTPTLMQPLIDALTLSPASPLSTLLIDIVIVGLAVFILLPVLNKFTRRLFAK